MDCDTFGVTSIGDVCSCRKGGNGRVGRRGRAVRLSLTPSARHTLERKQNESKDVRKG